MKIIQNMTLRSNNYWMSWKTAKKRKLLMRWSGPSQYNRSLPLKTAFFARMGWEPLKSFRENYTWSFYTFPLFLCRTVHQWLITRIPMGRWVRIPFRSLAIRKTTLAILFITVGMRWALEVQGGYLQQTISWFNFLHFTTNFAVLHSAVFIDKLWKSIFQLISAISLRKMCWFLTSVYISADFSYFFISRFLHKISWNFKCFSWFQLLSIFRF